MRTRIGPKNKPRRNLLGQDPLDDMYWDESVIWEGQDPPPDLGDDPIDDMYWDESVIWNSGGKPLDSGPRPSTPPTGADGSLPKPPSTVPGPRSAPVPGNLPMPKPPRAKKQAEVNLEDLWHDSPSNPDYVAPLSIDEDVSGAPMPLREPSLDKRSDREYKGRPRIKQRFNRFSGGW